MTRTRVDPLGRPGAANTGAEGAMTEANLHARLTHQTTTSAQPPSRRRCPRCRAQLAAGAFRPTAPSGPGFAWRTCPHCNFEGRLGEFVRVDAAGRPVEVGR
jgi:hypothetical protein